MTTTPILQDPDVPELTSKAKALKPLVDRANRRKRRNEDDSAASPIAQALGLTAAQAKEARNLGFL